MFNYYKAVTKTVGPKEPMSHVFQHTLDFLANQRDMEANGNASFKHKFICKVYLKEENEKIKSVVFHKTMKRLGETDPAERFVSNSR